MPHRSPLRAILAVSVLSSALLVLHNADSRDVTGTTGSVHSAAFAVNDLPLRVVSASGLIQRGPAWLVSPRGGTLVVSVTSSGQPMRSASLAGRLVGAGTAQISIEEHGKLRAVPLEEPLARDGAGTFAAGPIDVDASSQIAQVRVTIIPSHAGERGLALRDLRVNAVVTSAGVPCAAGICAPAGYTISAQGNGVGLATAQGAPLSAAQDQGAATTASDLVISRIGWGCPDGETSPRWVPFYQQPFHIIVHHTDAPAGPGGSNADLQNIWAFHTFTRAWGDIGYNYVIDPEGRIYEGRAGGDQSVGGHTHEFNIGAIGIALIGDYTTDRPSAPMLQALQRLVTALSNRYGINPQRVQTAQGVTFSDLGGHRDFNQTDCPGNHVYDLLPGLRASVARNIHSSAEPASGPMLYVHSGGPTTALLQVRNTGSTTWNGHFSVRRLSGSLFDLPSGYNVPGVPPSGTISIPLFLPALRRGTTIATRWQLFDATGYAAGKPFVVTLHVLAAGAVPPRQSPTAVVTQTPVRVATHTPVPTSTRTAKPAATTTRQPTHTPTPKPHATAKVRATATSTATKKPTPKPSATMERTATPVPTFTPLSTVTPKPSATASHSPTPSITSTPLIVPTPLVLQVPTVAPGSIVPASHSLRDGKDGRERRPLAGGPTGHVSVARDVRQRMQQLGSEASATGATYNWYFAEGSSARSERETIAFLNPGTRSAAIVTTLIRADGHHVYAVTDVPPMGRGTLDAGEAAGSGDLLGAVVHSSEPIIAERTVYHASSIDEGTGAASTPGVAAPAARWYLPRLPLARDETERLAILNPSPASVTVAVSAVQHGVLRPLATLRLPALTVHAVQMPAGATSAVVTANSSTGVVVEERTLYGKSRGYTVSAGQPSLITEGYLPVPGAGAGRDTLMLLNPNSANAHITLTRVNGGSARHVSVQARGQIQVPLKGDENGDASVLRLQADRPVAIEYLGYLPPSLERTLAHDYHGSVTAPAAQPGLVHAFAEGDTRLMLSDPRETLILANPGTGRAQIRITMLATGGRTVSQQTTLQAGGTERIAINGWGPAGQHGLLVTADQPVLAARSIDFNLGTDRLLSYGVTP